MSTPAAGCSALGLGSDLGGSVRVPVAWCGLYGLRPTARRLPMGPLPVASAGGAEGIVAPPGPPARHAADLALEQALARAEQGSAGLPVAVQEPAHCQKKGPGLERGTGPGFSAWSGAGVQKQQGSSPMQQAAPATQQAAPAANTWTEVLNSNTADSDFRILAFMTTSRN